MFDLGSLGEILIIAIAALILLGPKEIPQVLRVCGRWTQKIRNLTAGVRHEIDQHISAGEFEEYSKQTNTEVLKKQRQDDEE